LHVENFKRVYVIRNNSISSNQIENANKTTLTSLIRSLGSTKTVAEDDFLNLATLFIIWDIS